MSMTKMMLKAWIDAVLKPKLTSSMRDGIPLEELGNALVGYGAGVLRKGCGKTPDEVRKVLEDALAAPPES
jgi:hypothetical protein